MQGNSTVTVTNGTAEGGAVTLDVVDVNCTDCLNATEIEDIYLLNSGDTLTGELVFYNAATSASTTEGAVYYDTDDDNLYVYTSAGFVDLTQQDTDTDTTYTAGNDLDLSGTEFALETTLDFVDTINLAGTGTLNGLDAVDATTENTIEGLIFDADAENISGAWEVQDGVTFAFGTDADIQISYDEATDDRLEITDGTNLLLSLTDTGTTGNLAVTGDLTVSGDDIFLGTNTTGFILVADGTNYNPVDVTGDVEINSSGATTIQADSVALGTDTTGNYVATIADAGNSTVTVTNGTAEGGAVTLDVVDVNCTDCLNATEIEDIYLLNSGDTLTGRTCLLQCCNFCVHH